MGLILFFPHPGDIWQTAHDVAKTAVGDIRVDHDPHITLLYLGKARQGSKMSAIKEAVSEALDGVAPVTMKGEGITSFTPSESSEGNTPVIIKYEPSDHLSKLSVRVLRALAPFTHAKQFLDYAPHATLGYAEGKLSTEQRLQLSHAEGGSSEWVANELILADGETIHAKFSLTGVAKADEHSSEVGKQNSDVTWGCQFLTKSEDDKQIVTGIVLEPDEVDLQNDTISPEEIEAAAHRFLARYNRLTKMGLMHQMFGNIGVELVESWIARADTEMNGAPVKKGSWLMSVHVTSKALWGKIKEGAITGFSIGGSAKVD